MICCLMMAAVVGRCIYLALPKNTLAGEDALPQINAGGPVIVGGLSENWLASLGLGIAVTLIVAIIATILGWMTAWHLLRQSARARRLLLALAFIPMVMPAAISYAGWWLLRQPTWPLGDYLATHASGNTLTLLGQITAVITMGLWLWPVTTILLWLRLRQVSIETLWARWQLTGTGSTQLLMLRLCAARLALTILLAMQLAMSSAVSLHLTQLPVPSVDVWARLALDPTLQAGWPGGVAWLAVCMITAAVVCFVVIRQLLTPRVESESLTDRTSHDGLHRFTPRSARLLTWLALVCGCCVPLCTSALTLRRWEFVPAFWREHGASVRQSLEQGLIVAGIMLLMTLAWSIVFMVIHRKVASGLWLRASIVTLAAALTLAMTLAIAPGVLIGQGIGWLLGALGLAGTSPGATEDLVVPISHALRFAILPMVAAGVLVLPASRDGDDLRRSLPLTTHFMRRLIWQPGFWLILLTAAAGMLLSMQEIEVALQITPPGRRSLAIVLLDMLHMNSVQELASVMVQVLVIASFIAWACWLIAGRLLRQHND